MGRRSPKHTSEMRQAVVRAVATDGLAIERVVELAAAG
jgi:hypothetical protein